MKRPDYWVDQHLVVKCVNWDKKPNMHNRPIIFCDKPVNDERLRALWLESEGKPKKFARLIEAEHGIREFELEKR